MLFRRRSSASSGVAGGFAVTFSKPMDPATVEDIHNYSVKFSPNQNFSLANLYGVGLIQTLSTAKTPIPLRRGSYDPATNTVTLITNEPLGPNGSYEISNAPSLLAKKARPYKAQPLTDLEGNVLNQGGKRRRHVFDHDRQGQTIRGGAGGPSRRIVSEGCDRKAHLDVPA